MHCASTSVTVREMETFLGPWAEISVLKEDVMGPEHEQALRFKVSVSSYIRSLIMYQYKHLKRVAIQVDKLTERIFLMVPKRL